MMSELTPFGTLTAPRPGGGGEISRERFRLAILGDFSGRAARGLMETENDAEQVARKAMAIAADICVYTNGNLTVETITK